MELLRIPAALGDVDDALAPLHQHLPEAAGILDTAWQAAADAHDGQRLPGGCLGDSGRARAGSAKAKAAAKLLGGRWPADLPPEQGLNDPGRRDVPLRITEDGTDVASPHGPPLLRHAAELLPEVEPLVVPPGQPGADLILL